VYVLTSKDGTQYRIDAATGDLLTVKDTNGNTLTYSDDAIVSSTGQKITFERDSQGRIVSVKDPMQEYIRYGYDASGDLVSVTDRTQNTTRMVYDTGYDDPNYPGTTDPGRAKRNHYLREVIDPLGRVGARSEYDDVTGRLRQITDSAGNPVDFTYDVDNQVQTVTDAIGRVTTQAFDERGNLVRQRNNLGHETIYTYDQNNNLLTTIDPLGRKTSSTYNAASDILSETDALGQTTFYSYNSTGQMAAVTDPLGNTVRYSYDSTGNLTKVTDALGRSSSIQLDATGSPTSVNAYGVITTKYEAQDALNRPTKTTNAQGKTTEVRYDAMSNILEEKIAVQTSTGLEMVSTQYEYNANSQVTLIRNVDLGTVRIEYNKLGQKTAVVSAQGIRLEYEYDGTGNLVLTRYPDGTNESKVYDVVGQLASETDRRGNTIRYVYDAIGRLKEVIYPDSTPNDLTDNLRSTIVYDDAGQVLSETDVFGNKTEYFYDLAGQMIRQKNADQNEITIIYDKAGRAISAKDPLGQITQYVYDAAGSRTKTIFADGKSLTTEGEVGKSAKITTPDGKSVKYELSPTHQVTAVIDELGNRSEYLYDTNGNVTQRKDANSSITRYEYNRLGQRVATVLPNLDRATDTYDQYSRLATSTDFNGQAMTYEYDNLGRLAKKTLAEGTEFIYTYNAKNQLKQIQQGTQATSQTYDEWGRITSRTTDGLTIGYSYGANGELTVTSPNSATTYIYNDLNQLMEVRDSKAGNTLYEYDAAGNVKKKTLANGVVESRQYNVNNLLTLLVTKDTGGNTLFSQQITYDQRRNIIKLEENSGRVVNFTYDLVDQLTREEILEGPVVSRVISYRYDAVGNRLERNDSVEGITTYTYNGMNQLASSAKVGITTTYIYDDNGSLIRQESPTKLILNQWNSEKRLVGVTITENGVTHNIHYKYNTEGIRTAQIVDGQETRYLIDVTRPYAQVREEYQADGDMMSYVSGLGGDILSQVEIGDNEKRL
jgi:YD repeat-containing protein